MCKKGMFNVIRIYSEPWRGRIETKKAFAFAAGRIKMFAWRLLGCSREFHLKEGGVVEKNITLLGGRLANDPRCCW